MLEAYLGVDLDGLGLEEEADAPFVPFECGPCQSCVSVLWQMQHTRRHRVPEHARSVGEHAGVRRAPCDEDACAKLGGAAGWRHSQRGRALYSELWGKWRRLGRARRRKQQRRRGRGRPREAHAAAHIIRIVPVDVPSKADQPRELRLLAVPCGLPHGLAHRVAHRVRRALQAFARSDTCAFGGARAAPL